MLFDCHKHIHLILSGLAVCFCFHLEASTGTPFDFGAKADGITVDYDAIQKAINEFDVIVFPAGRYVIDDRDYIRIPSNKRLQFKKGAVLHFVNSRNRRFGAVLYIKGDNVCVDGLTFVSSSMVSREFLSTSDRREGLSSLATAIMSDGNNVVLRNISISNAEFGFFLKGSDYSLYNVRVNATQPLYAEDCSNLTIQNFRSQLPDIVSPYDHHIYLKGNCRGISIDKSTLIGGDSFAIQLSADYNDLSRYPRNVVIKRTTISGSSKCIVIDGGKTDVSCVKLNCHGKEGDGGSYFASNRGGRLDIKESTINGFTYIERDHAHHSKGNRGNSLYLNCDFSFNTSESCAFDLLFIDELVIRNCTFKYRTRLKAPGFIIRVDSGKNSVGDVRLLDNSFYIQQAVDSYVMINSTDTNVTIERNKFYNLGKDIEVPIPANTSNLTMSGNSYSGTTEMSSSLRSIDDHPRFRGKSFVRWISMFHRLNEL